MEFTVIGGTVNLAARVEASPASHDAGILSPTPYAPASIRASTCSHAADPGPRRRRAGGDLGGERLSEEEKRDQ